MARIWLPFLLLWTTASFGAECQPRAIQDFLKREIVKRSLIPELAQQKSINYRVRHYGHLPESPQIALNPKSVKEALVTLNFLGHEVQVHQKVLKPLSCVEQELSLCLQNFSAERISSWRDKNSYRGGEISNHRFGLAIDIDPHKNPCCGCVEPWSQDPLCRNLNLTAFDRVSFPLCTIAAFEKHGFYWLGRDEELQDTMHFEFLAAPDCPEDMVQIYSPEEGEHFCIDRYEYPNQKNQRPSVAHTAKEAEALCEKMGKRLCSDQEWETSCKGQKGWKFPYGPNYKQGVCNDDKIWRAPNWALIQHYNPLNPDENVQARDHVQLLNQSTPSGSYQNCLTTEGVFDLTGNAAEWVRNSKKKASSIDGQIHPHAMKGCFWSKCYKNQNPSCQFTNPNHTSSFRSYEASFRCCL